MNKSSKTFGSHDGTPEGILLEDPRTIEISVNVSASQVRTPTVKSNLIMAFVRMKIKKPVSFAEKISQS